VTEDSKSWASSASSASTPRCDEVVLTSRVNAIRRQWTTGVRTIDPDISPMRAALVTWGLTIDDITIVYLHGTSTKANDFNEPETLQKQMKHLGRQGPSIIAMCQKSITGHPKAPAAAWVLNCCLQAIMTGVVPGNYACDNIDSALAEFDHLVFPSETLKVGEIKAFLLNLFGFGQKGAQMIGVAPKYLFAALGEEEYLSCVERCGARKRMINRAFAKAIMTNTIVRAHDHTAYKADDTLKVLLDPLVRAERTTPAGMIRFEFGPQSLVLSRS
jgi:fatty acid synthase subunit alpha, fungi type